MTRTPRIFIPPLALFGVLLGIVAFETPALAQGAGAERHVSRSKYELLFAEGNKVEARAQEQMEGGNKDAKKTYRKALRTYQKVMALNPKFEKAYLRIAHIYGVLGEHQPAAAVLKRALGLRPNDTDLKDALGLHLFYGGYKQEAIVLLEAAVAGNRGGLDLLVMVTDFYRSTNKPRKTLPLLRRILRQKPKAHNRRVQLGTTLIRLNQPKKAQAACAKVPKSAKKHYAPAQICVGDALLRDHKTKEALGTYQALAKTIGNKTSQGRQLSLKIAGTLERLGYHRKALKLCVGYTAREPRSARGYLCAGDSLRSLGRCQDSEKQLQYALRLYSRSSRIYRSLAKTYARCKKLPLARKNLAQAIRMAPKDWTLKSFRGNLLRREGKVKQAYDLHRKLAKTRPWSGRLRAELGHDLYYSGQLPQAKASYRQAFKIDPELADARRGLALIGLRDARKQLRTGKLNLATETLQSLHQYGAYQGHINAALAASALLGKRAKAAKGWYDKTPKARRDYWLLQLARGHALLEMGKATEAAAVLGKIDRTELRGRRLAAVQYARAAAEARAGNYETAVAHLRQLSGNRSDKLLAAVSIANARQRWKQGEAKAALKQLGEAKKLSKFLSPENKKRARLLQALAAAENNQAKDALKGLAAFNKMKRPRSSALLVDEYADRSGLNKLQAYLNYRVGAYDRAAKLLARTKSADDLMTAILRGRIYQSYVSGRYGRASKASAQLAKKGKKKGLAAEDKLLHACLDYQMKRKASALKVFQTLAAKIPEAQLNLGIYQDDVERDKRAAYDHYVKYIKRPGAVALAKAQRWVKIKQRIFGFQ